MSHNSGFAGTAASPRGAEGPTGGSGEPDDEAAIAAALGVTCELRKRAEEAAAVARAATLAKAAQLAWKSPAVWQGSRPDLPSTRDGGHTFVTWNLAGAWSRVSSKDPRRRQNRVHDILDACHFLGVAVAVFPESGLGYDDEQGEKMVASWARDMDMRQWIRVKPSPDTYTRVCDAYVRYFHFLFFRDIPAFFGIF